MPILIIVAVLALGGGVTFVAESSLPGDALYVVKTSVNEEVRGLLAVGAEADAEWETELAVRRITEAAELQKRGELTAEIAEDLNAEFISHVEAALEAAANIGSSGQDGVSLTADIQARITAVQQAQGGVVNLPASVSGERSFVLPHVLEADSNIKSPRDSASGQATGRVQSNDVSSDSVVEVQTDTQAEGGASGSTGGSETSASASGGGELKATYDLKTNTR